MVGELSMKIVVDINHPAHVHFFKNFIWKMREIGHEILITASQKDVSLHLLDNLGFEYINLGSYGASLVKKFINLPVLDLRMYKAIRSFKPDIFVGLGSIRAAHISKLVGKPCIIFYDTENATEQYLLFAPFASVICTPSSFKKDIGNKQIRYKGCHELAYLYPKYFKADPAVLDEYGLSQEENIFIIRFAAFDGTNDRASGKISKETVIKLVNKLERVGKVIISSEVELDNHFAPYRYRLPPEKYHDVLYYSKMYVGEGSTSAEEAAILGVPSIHFERIKDRGRICAATECFGVLDELQNKYELLYSYCDENALINKVDEFISRLDRIKGDWKIKRDRFLRDKIDVTQFMIWFVEKYPGSVYAMKNILEYQFEFRMAQEDE